MGNEIDVASDVGRGLNVSIADEVPKLMKVELSLAGDD